MKKIICAIIFAIILISPIVVSAGKTTISVMDLSVSEGLTQPQVLMLTDKLLNDLVTAGIYQVVERSKRDDILKEQGFQQTGACDQGACLVEAGQLLGVQKMVGGTLGKLGTVFSLQLRVIDVKTGEIDKAFSKSFSGDISLLLDGMRVAAAYFSGVNIATAPAMTNEGENGLVFLRTNAQGYREYKNVKDGSVLIQIPAGEFTMGSSEGEKNENPARKVYLDTYYIGKYEVTASQYLTFCKASGYSVPALPQQGYGGDCPVVNLTWQDAKAYCTWAGLILPTEAQWEKGARGTDARIYPWGNNWDNEKCNWGSKADGYKEIALVGSFPTGASPYGCLDMAGNAREWCSDWYGEDYYIKSTEKNPTGPSTGSNRALRGGSWDDTEKTCRTYSRGNSDPEFGTFYRGFFSATGEDMIGFRIAK